MVVVTCAVCGELGAYVNWVEPGWFTALAGTAGDLMYATAGFLRELVVDPLLLLLLLLLLLGVLVCLANAVSTGKFPLRSELST